MPEAVIPTILERSAYHLRNTRTPRGNPIGLTRAIGNAFGEYGRSELKEALSTALQSAKIDPITGQATIKPDHERITQGWVHNFVGIVMPLFDETPANGWSTRRFIAEHNTALSEFNQFGMTANGVSMTDITMEMIFQGVDPVVGAQSTDRNMTAVITDYLQKYRQPEYFFTDLSTLQHVSTIYLLLFGYKNAFTLPILECGQSVAKYRELIGYIYSDPTVILTPPQNSSAHP